MGEVIRYKVTYTPSQDRILPSPPYLYLKVKNTSAIALRAAFVHGPYTLYVSSAPENFEANQKFETPRRDGVPEFEPNLKAGGTWHSQLSVPESVRKTAGSARRSTDQPNAASTDASVSWIIEVASQVIFSNSAVVHYEILLGRDEKSLSLGFGGLNTGGTGGGIPGQVSDHQQSQGAKDGHHSAQPKGVFSRAIRLRVDDTASLWNKPRLPERNPESNNPGREKGEDAPTDSHIGDDKPEVEEAPKKQRKVHLVVLTHGLHSNLGADMLYMKESIDQAAAKAKEDAKIRRAKRRQEKKRKGSTASERLRARERTDRAFGTNPDGKHEDSPADKVENDEDEDTDDEEVVVRGFSGNAVRTEKGIKYLGKRLAKYVLSVTYPDQPFKPIRRSTSQSITSALKGDSSRAIDDKIHGPSVHSKSTIHLEPHNDKKLAYKITSISFIAHSLGGLIQTYAVAYIQKHSPQFFDFIKPINFIAMATPFLGLSNENPLYVKFALDFGLVGRTGQDLGLTWRAPTLARSGWGALVSGIGEGAHKRLEGEQDPGSKPLLRILPTGPAHTALRKFRNRTVYSNVVNDGIVPLRTSCLLFLDWQGLGRVEKARRENGLVGTMVGWGWAEVTGANASAGQRRPRLDGPDSDSMDDTESSNTPTHSGHGVEVPQPAIDETADDNRSLKTTQTRPTSANSSLGDEDAVLTGPAPTGGTTGNGGPLESILGLFRANPSPKPPSHGPKIGKIYRRSQTIKASDEAVSNIKEPPKGRSKATSGENESDNPDLLSAPPKTTFFEAAGDILNPPLPSVEFLIDPTTRPRTIFHDRVYHPEDIPPPPLKRRSGSLLVRRSSSGNSPSPLHNRVPSDSDSAFSSGTSEVIDGSAMKVEEKIARAYHRDMSWRKVLVRLEPDAHNNMIVRRKFANAYGWPVVKHLVDTHFSDQAVARMRDEDEGNQERAKSSEQKPTKSGNEIKESETGNTLQKSDEADGIRHLTKDDRTDSENREATDGVPPLNSLHPGSLARALNEAKSSKKNPGHQNQRLSRQDSAQWSDGDFMDSDGDSDAERPDSQHQTKRTSGNGWNWTEAIAGKGATSPRQEKMGTSKKEIEQFLGGGPALDGVGGKSTEASKDDVTTLKGVDTVPGSLGLRHSFENDGHAGVVEQVAKLSIGGEHRGSAA